MRPLFQTKTKATLTFALFAALLFTSLVTSPAPLHAKDPATKDKAEKSTGKKPANKKAWALLCDKKKKNCRLYAHIKTDQNVVASSLSIAQLKLKGIKSEQTVAFIMLPLGLHIPSGVTVQIDKSISLKANLIECKASGCRAIFNVQNKVLAHMLTGQKINILIVDSKSRKKLRLSYSLKDFDKTYKAFVATN